MKVIRDIMLKTPDTYMSGEFFFNGNKPLHNSSHYTFCTISSGLKFSVDKQFNNYATY